MKPGRQANRRALCNVAFEHVEKVYPNGFHAVQDLNLEIEDGEFLVLVGPPAAVSPPPCA